MALAKSDIRRSLNQTVALSFAPAFAVVAWRSGPSRHGSCIHCDSGIVVPDFPNTPPASLHR
ncbi:MAG TPA: hypothetical protein VHX65_17605 [Pirellulales bacterium]|nr:hypothetical protein [Pirellulales bacterium]